MDMPKRFYWLKLNEDFFRQKEIKKLRRIAGGDTFTIIYLKMLLRSLKDGGRLYYEGVEDNFVTELAMDIDEDEENTRVTVAFLTSSGILVQNGPDEYEVLTSHEMTGSECDSAHRVRASRARKAIENSEKALLCNGAVTDCNREIDIEKDIEKDIDNKAHKPRQRFQPPTLEEVRGYAREKGYTAQEFSPEDFVDYYSSKGWQVGRNGMKDWRASVRLWVSRYRKEHPQAEDNSPPVLTLAEIMRRSMGE